MSVNARYSTSARGALRTSGMTMHVNKVHHVKTITRIAEDLGEDEDWLRDVASEMEIRGRRHLGLMASEKMASRHSHDFGIENLIELVRIYKENPTLAQTLPSNNPSNRLLMANLRDAETRQWGAPHCRCPRRDDCRSIRLLCSSLDHLSDRGRLRDKDSVACGHFGDLGARTLIHPALKLEGYYAILGGQDGVAGLVVPSRHGEGRTHGLLGKLLLRVRHELSFRRRDIRGIGFPELRRRDEEILVRRGPIGGRPHGIVWRGELRRMTGRWPPRIGLQGGHIDEGADLGVGARFRDHRAAIAVADQHDRPRLLIDNALGGIHVLGEAGERLLHDSHMEAVFGQDVVDGAPA